MTHRHDRPPPIPASPPGDLESLPAYLAAFTNFETQRDLPVDRRALGPARCRALIEHASGLPVAAHVVQIAGSKGKGSTTLWIEALLRQRGETVVATMSPHLERIEERLRIDGRTSSGEEFLAALEKLHPALLAIDRADATLRPTFFDLMTAAAVATAAARSSEWLLLEVGLGGPLDSTSAVPHEVGVLSTVDLEHCAQLGNTLPEIAAEKARIATAGQPLLVQGGPGQSAEAIEAARAVATERGALFRWVGEDGRIPPSVQTPQRENLALALAAIEACGSETFTDAEIAGVAGEIALPGRLELLSGPPPLLLDGAHTIASVAHFARRFRELCAEEPGTLLVGAMHDKEWVRAFAPLLADPAIEWIATSAGGPRAADPAEIARTIEEAGRRVTVLPLDTAIDQLRTSHGRTRGVTGSFHLAGAVRRRWLEGS